jgi:phytoene dehydrogenase-like protein
MMSVTSRIEGQIERFAPGFRDTILARHTSGPADLERRNPNLVGGDIAAGVTDLRQFVARPTLSWYSLAPRKSASIPGNTVA